MSAVLIKRLYVLFFKAILNFFEAVRVNNVSLSGSTLKYLILYLIVIMNNSS